MVMVNNRNERGITMTDITKVNEYTITGKFDIAGSIKADEDSTESKTFILRVNMNQVPVKSIITKALAQVRIDWARVGRKKFDKMTSGQVVEIDFNSPGKNVKTREEQIAEYKQALVRTGMKEQDALDLATKMVDVPGIVPTS